MTSNIFSSSQWNSNSCQFVLKPLHLYSWVKRGILKVKCFAQEHNILTLPGLEPEPQDPKSSALMCIPIGMSSNIPVIFTVHSEYLKFILDCIKRHIPEKWIASIVHVHMWITITKTLLTKMLPGSQRKPVISKNFKQKCSLISYLKRVTLPL